jgi:hypothetical protein
MALPATLLEDNPNSNHLPHPYFCQLLAWEDTNTKAAFPGIAHYLRIDELHVCSDGAYDPDSKQGSHANVFFMQPEASSGMV